MARFDFVRPGGQYSNATVLGQADYQRFDVKQFKSLNGDDGGAWSPITPIVIGGSGMQFTTSGTDLRGGWNTASGGRVVLGVNDFPVLAPARTRSIVMPLTGVHTPSGNTSLFEDTYVQIVATPAFGITLAAGTIVQLSVPSRLLHHGANLATVTLNYRVLTRPSVLPTAGQYVLLFSGANAASSAVWAGTGASLTTWAIATAYTINTYLHPTAAKTTGYYYKATAIAGTGTSGGAEPTWPTTVGATVVDNAGANQITWTCIGRSGKIAPPASVDAFFAAGAPQSVSLDFDPAVPNTIDTRAYRYVVTPWGGYGGAQDPNILLHSVTFAFSNITSYAPQ